MQHQIAAVIVAVAEHARLAGGELLDDRRPFFCQRRSLRSRDHRAAVALDEVLREEVELPRELLDVERDAVGDVAVRVDLGAAALQQVDERDGLPVERRVLGGRRRAEMGLQRDVAEILERENAERIGVAEQCRHRQRICRSSAATLANGSEANSIGPTCSARTMERPSGWMMRK